ncbi:hypothetical protein D3C81_2337220 [compost metagenome]
MDFTIARRAREEAAAAAKAAAEHKAAEEAFALADLIGAYSPKTKAKVKQEAA